MYLIFFGMQRVISTAEKFERTSLEEDRNKACQKERLMETEKVCDEAIEGTIKEAKSEYKPTRNQLVDEITDIIKDELLGAVIIVCDSIRKTLADNPGIDNSIELRGKINNGFKKLFTSSKQDEVNESTSEPKTMRNILESIMKRIESLTPEHIMISQEKKKQVNNIAEYTEKQTWKNNFDKNAQFLHKCIAKFLMKTMLTELGNNINAKLHTSDTQRIYMDAGVKFKAFNEIEIARKILYLTLDSLRLRITNYLHVFFESYIQKPCVSYGKLGPKAISSDAKENSGRRQEKLGAKSIKTWVFKI